MNTLLSNTPLLFHVQVCTTLGLLTPDQAQELRQAGLTAYNHNLDTSPEFYEKVTTTRKYEVRMGLAADVERAHGYQPHPEHFPGAL